MMTRHDDIVAKLEDRLWKTGKYEKIRMFEEYDCGEIDLLATTYVNGARRLLLFEIKTTHKKKRRDKAIEQLYRAEREMWPGYEKTYLFYVHGTKTGYKVNRIKG